MRADTSYLPALPQTGYVPARDDIVAGVQTNDLGSLPESNTTDRIASDLSTDNAANGALNESMTLAALPDTGGTLLARADTSPRVVSTTDRGWVGNPDTGRVVWVRYRAFSDGSTDVLVSQGARGTGPSYAFAGEVDIGTIRDNLGNSATRIYSVSSFSRAATVQPAAANASATERRPTVRSVTDQGWVGNPETGRVVWVRYRTLGDGSTDVVVSKGARGTGPSYTFAGEVDLSRIRDNLGNTSSRIYAISTYSAATQTRPAAKVANPAANAVSQPRTITEPAQILALAQSITPQRYAISLETQLGEDLKIGNVTIPASAKAKIQFAVPASAFANGISAEALPGILASGAVTASFEVAGQPAIKLTYNFAKNQFTIAQETKRIDDIKLFGGIGKISWKDGQAYGIGGAGQSGQGGTGVSVALYLAGKDSVFSTLANVVDAGLTVAQGASIAAAIPTGGASLAGTSLMQVLKKVLKEAISNGRLSIEASYPANVSVDGRGGRIQIGNNSVNLNQMGDALLQQIPLFRP